MLCFRFKSVLVLLTCLIFSCSEDEGYTSVKITTISDEAELFQEDEVTISIFQNDSDLPDNGTISFGNPQGGAIELKDVNNTPYDPFDDVLIYTSTREFEGTDSFSYTVCETESENNCSTAQVNISVKPRSFVNSNLENFPFEKLSDYNFFQGNLSDLNPSYKVIPYELNSALFSDYAKKKRFVWVPKESIASFEEDYEVLDFPVGTILIKNFYYENVLPNDSKKLIETRLMFLTDEGWKFAEYVWNEDQTDAFFDDSGSFKNISWTDDNGESKSVNYRIPSKTECFTCHNSYGTPLPIGPKPQNLDKNVNLGQGLINQINYLISEGIIENSAPTNINSTVDWEDDTNSLQLRARSYLDINCAHCHSNQSYCDYRQVRFAFNETIDPSNLGVCIDPDEPIEPYGEIVIPNNSEESLLLFRLSSTVQQYRMPLLGRTLQHKEGVALIEAWINSLEGNCE